MSDQKDALPKAEDSFKSMSEEEREQCADLNETGMVDENLDAANPTIVQYLCDIGKRFSGYRYISLSRFNGFPPNNRPLSATGEMLRVTYSLTQGVGDKEFAEAFGSGEIGLIQVHTEMPPLHEDGFYDKKDLAGKLIKTKNVGFVKILDKDNFRPCLVIKQGGGAYGYIEGNPFHEVSGAEFKRAVELLQKPAE